MPAGEYEAKTALQMATTTMEATSRVMAALINALSSQTQNPRNLKTLDAFRRSIANGDRLLTIPVDRQCAARFEEIAKLSSALLYKTRSVSKPDVYEYIFREKDSQYINQTVLKMRSEGMEVMQSRQVNYETLSSIANGHLHSATYSDQHAAQMCCLHLDTYSIPHAVVDFPSGMSEVVITTDDHDRIKDMPEFAGNKFQDTKKKMTMVDVNRIVRERTEEESKKREKSKARGSKGRE